MANRDKASRRGLMAYSHKQSVEDRLLDANNEAIGKNADYRYVHLGIDVFPIHKDMVKIYYDSDRSFKRGIKKRFKKLMKKYNNAISLKNTDSDK